MKIPAIIMKTYVSLFMIYTKYKLFFNVIFCIILAILFIYFAIRFIFSSYFSYLFRILVVPRPLLDYDVLKRTTFLIENENLKMIIEFRRNIELKFGDPYAVPIILCIGNKLSFGDPDAIYQTSEHISFEINNRVSIIYIKENLISEISQYLTDIFRARSLNSIVFTLNFSEIIADPIKYSEFIKKQVFLLENCINVQPLVYFLNKIDNFENFYTLSESIPDSSIIGISDLSSTNSVNNLITQLQDELLISNKNFKNHSLSLFFLIKNSEHLQLFLNEVVNIPMKTGGLFLYTNYDEKDIFITDLFNNKINYETRNITGLEEKSAIKTFLNRVMYVSILLSCIYFVYELKKSSDNLGNLGTVVHRVTENLKIRQSCNLNDAIDLSLKDCTKPVKYGFYNMENQLSKIRNFLILKQARTIEDVDDLEIAQSKEEFLLLTDLKAFDVLKKQINKYCEMANNIAITLSDNQLLLKDHLNIMGDQILKDIRLFLDLIQHNKIYGKINSLKNILDLFFSNGSKDNLFFARDQIKKLRVYLENTNNLWFIDTTFPIEYQKVLNLIKDVPIIGNTLFESANNVSVMNFNQLRENILNADHFTVGKILKFTDGKLWISKDLEDLEDALSTVVFDNLFQLNCNTMSLNLGINKNFINLWNIDILDGILDAISYKENFDKNVSKYQGRIQKIFEKTACVLIENFIKNSIASAQMIMPNTTTLIEKVSNLNTAFPKLQVILNYLNKTLKSDINIKPLFVDTAEKIYSDIYSMLENTIYTSYKTIDQWQGDSLLYFLFQANEEEISFLLTKNMRYLQNIKDKMIMPVLNYINIYYPSGADFLRYVNEQLESSASGKANDLSIFDNFIISLKDWNLQYRPERVENIGSQDFFRYHLNSFKSKLSRKTNQIVFARSTNLFNEIVALYNKNIGSKMPWNTDNLPNYWDFKEFLEVYSRNRELILQDKAFVKLNSDAITILENIYNYFKIENDEIVVLLKLHYNTKDSTSTNTQIIKKYITETNGETYTDDVLDIKYKIKSSFVLKILISDNSVLELDTNKSTYECTTNQVILEHLNQFGLFTFAEEFNYKQTDGYLVDQISLPIVNKNTKDSSNLHLYLRIFDMPYFPKKI